MRNVLFLLAFALLAFGVFFARDRVRRACQIGAVLYAIILVVRLLVYGSQDSDNFLDILGVGSMFFAIWLAGWAATRAILQYRARDRQPPP